MTPRERAYQLRDALRARDIALDVTAVDAVEAAILADRAERDAVRESACAAYERALAEQAAGEAERTAQAVAREREACAVLCETWTNVYPGASYARGCAARIRARATSPAPCVCGCPASEHDARNIVGEIERDCAAHGYERYYDSTCTLGEPAPEPVAAERAERCSVCGRPTTVGEEFGGPCVYASDAACAERAVVEAAVEWRACLSAKRATGSVLCPPGKSCGAALEAAVDALAAARQDGAR